MDTHGRTSAGIESDGGERSIAETISDIVANTQSIIRSEIKLARIELGETARAAKSSGIAFAAGGLFSIYAFGFILLAIMFVLALVLPSWLAALIVGLALSIGAAIGVTAGRERLKSVRAPQGTIETVKEDLQWMKEKIKS